MTNKMTNKKNINDIQKLAFIASKAICYFSTKGRKDNPEFLEIFHSIVDSNFDFSWEGFIKDLKLIDKPSFLHFLFKYETDYENLLKWFESYKKQEDLTNNANPWEIEVKDFSNDTNKLSLMGMALKYKQVQLFKKWIKEFPAKDQYWEDFLNNKHFKLLSLGKQWKGFKEINENLLSSVVPNYLIEKLDIYRESNQWIFSNKLSDFKAKAPKKINEEQALMWGQKIFNVDPDYKKSGMTKAFYGHNKRNNLFCIPMWKSMFFLLHQEGWKNWSEKTYLKLLKTQTPGALFTLPLEVESSQNNKKATLKKHLNDFLDLYPWKNTKDYKQILYREINAAIFVYNKGYHTASLFDKTTKVLLQQKVWEMMGDVDNVPTEEEKKQYINIQVLLRNSHRNLYDDTMGNALLSCSEDEKALIIEDYNQLYKLYHSILNNKSLPHNLYKEDKWFLNMIGEHLKTLDKLSVQKTYNFINSVPFNDKNKALNSFFCKKALSKIDDKKTNESEKKFYTEFFWNHVFNEEGLSLFHLIRKATSLKNVETFYDLEKLNINKKDFKNNVSKMLKKQENSKSKQKAYIKSFLSKIYLTSEVNLGSNKKESLRKRKM